MIALIGAYIIGSIPSGFLIARFYGIDDIRCHGSGNIGATNVARMLGNFFFMLVLLFDAGKAYGYLLLLSLLGISSNILCCAALALLLGNSRSLFLRFTGGKGVSTTVGALLFLAPWFVVGAFVVWLIMLLMTRVVGKASVAAAVSVILLGIIFYLQKNNPESFTSVIMALWVIYLHKKNIFETFTN